MDLDPFDRSTTEPRRVAKTLLGLTVFYPIVTAVCLYGFYLMARIKLGYWPRPAHDDPGNVFDTAVHGIPLFSSIVGCRVLLLLVLGESRGRADPLWLSLFSSAPMIVFWVVVFGYDPGSVWTWLLD